MAFEGNILQWKTFYTFALNYLNILSMENCTFHLKVKEFIAGATSNFIDLSGGKAHRRLSHPSQTTKQHRILSSSGPDSRLSHPQQATSFRKRNPTPYRHHNQRRSPTLNRHNKQNCFHIDIIELHHKKSHTSDD